MLRNSKATLLAASIFAAAASPGFAQDIQLSLEPPPNGEDQVVDAGFTTTVSVPSVVAVNSSMDEGALRALLNGGFKEHAQELASLTADSISIPSMVVNSTTSAGVTSTITITDMSLTGVKNGVAATVGVGSVAILGGEGADKADIKLGSATGTAVDFAAILGYYGLAAPLTGTEFRQMYSGVEFAGGSIDTEALDCQIAGIHVGVLESRPLRKPYMDYTAELGAMSDAGTSMQSMGTLLGFYSDILSSQRGGSMSLDGFDCTGMDPTTQESVAVKIGKVEVGAVEPGRFPGFSINDISFSVGDKGSFALGQFAIKAVDFSGPIAAFDAVDPSMVEDWSKANWRSLIPAMDGLLLTGMSFDVPVPGSPGKLTHGEMASFDITLADYLNGVPTKLSTSIAGLVVPLPQDTTDPQIAMMLALGLTEFNGGFDIAVGWDKDSKTIVVENVALQGAGLAGIALSGTIVNAAEQLFDPNPEIAQIAALSVAVQDVRLDLFDAGLGSMLAPLAAEPADKTVEDVRTRLAGQVEGLVLLTLGATDEARALGVAIGNFIAGKAQSLSVQAVSKDPAGIPIPAFMQAAENPMMLTPLVTLSGAAQ